MKPSPPALKLFAIPLVVAMLALVGCGSDDDSSSSSDDGSTTTAADSSGDNAAAPSDADIEALTAELKGGGASFPDPFYQAVNSDFNGIHGSEIVTYAKSGSSDGRKQLGEQTLDYAGSDSLPKDDETFAGGDILLFPTVAAPITMSYNLAGVDELKLTPELISGIFQAEITSWDDPAIAEVNPDATLPSTAITVVHRSDGSGTTSNFTKYIEAAAPDTWKLGSGDEVPWPATTQGAEKNSGVAALIGQTDGAIGYVDLADAIKADLSTALIEDAGGEFVGPTSEGVQAALEGAELDEDLTYNPLNSEGEGAYPITAPTWLITYTTYPDADLVTSLQTYVRYVLTTGQEQAGSLGYVGIPETFQEKALAQIDEITAG